MDDQPKHNMKVVWTMVERTPQNGGAAKTYWTRVGVGFVNRDGSINLRLDAIPINGNLQVREWEPLERRQEGGTEPPPPRPRPRPSPTSDALL
jgi:hypothetical protein